MYKGYDNNVRILCNGKLYTYTKFEKARDELPKDEHGLIKDCKHVYLDIDLIVKIDDFLSVVNYWFYSKMRIQYIQRGDDLYVNRI